MRFRPASTLREWIAVFAVFAVGASWLWAIWDVPRREGPAILEAFKGGAALLMVLPLPVVIVLWLRQRWRAESAADRSGRPIKAAIDEVDERFGRFIGPVFFFYFTISAILQGIVAQPFLIARGEVLKALIVVVFPVVCLFVSGLRVTQLVRALLAHRAKTARLGDA